MRTLNGNDNKYFEILESDIITRKKMKEKLRITQDSQVDFKGEIL